MESKKSLIVYMDVSRLCLADAHRGFSEWSNCHCTGMRLIYTWSVVALSARIEAITNWISLLCALSAELCLLEGTKSMT